MKFDPEKNYTDFLPWESDQRKYIPNTAWYFVSNLWEIFSLSRNKILNTWIRGNNPSSSVTLKLLALTTNWNKYTTKTRLAIMREVFWFDKKTIKHILKAKISMNISQSLELPNTHKNYQKFINNYYQEYISNQIIFKKLLSNTIFTKNTINNISNTFKNWFEQIISDKIPKSNLQNIIPIRIFIFVANYLVNELDKSYTKSMLISTFKNIWKELYMLDDDYLNNINWFIEDNHHFLK